MKTITLLLFIYLSFTPDTFGQKLKKLTVKKKIDDIYSKEVYSVIKHGKHKNERHGDYTYSKFVKEVTGTYFLGTKDGEWRYDQSPDKYSEYYTKGHLDSTKGVVEGMQLLVHFDKLGDTSYFEKSKSSIPYASHFRRKSFNDTANFAQNGITSKKIGDTTTYYYSPKNILIGRSINGKQTGKWIWNTNTVTAVTSYKEGVPVGTHTSFYPSGQVMAIKSFDSFGEKDGPHVVFYENGDTASYQEFVNGGEEEPNESYYPNRGQQARYYDRSKKAEFIDGEKQLQLFIDNHIEYPAEALKAQKQGVVQVVFVVNPIGEIENLETLGNPDGYLLLEAMRVVKSTSLLWQPAIQDGFPVDMRMRIPINFKVY